MRRKDVLLITVDCLRHDFGGVQNNFLSKLKGESAYFENAYSHSSWTSPAFKSLFSSRYPLSMGGILDISQFETLPEYLYRSGFETHAILYGPNDFVGKYFNYHKIFQHYVVYDPYNHGFINKNIRRRAKSLAYTIRDYFPSAFYSYLLFNALSIPTDKKDDFYSFYTNIIKTSKSPKFVWIHTMDVHEPYYSGDANRKNLIEKIKMWSKNVPMVPKGKNKGEGENIPLYKEFDSLFGLLIENITGEKLKNLDANDVVKWLKMWYRERVNIAFGKIRDIIEIFERYSDNFITIVTADHGQEFMEHGYLGHCIHLYNELIRVPLIIYRYEKKGTFKNMVSHGDILPTLLDILSIEYNKNNFIGKNMFENKKRIIISENSENRKEDIHRIFAERRMIWEKRKIAVVTDEWKYINNYSTGKEELYFLKDDPQEENNMISTTPSILEDMRMIVSYHMKKLEREKKLMRLAYSLSQKSKDKHL